MRTDGGLLENRQHQAFVDAYLPERNATKAALVAGYSEKTARAQGSRLLTRVDIKAAIAQADVQVLEAVVVRHEAALGSAEWIVREGAATYAKAVAAEAFGPAVSALGLLAKRHPEFRDGPLVDNSQHVHLPDGLTVEELKALAGRS